MDKISVIIPIYNTEKYLEKSIRSVFDQTYDNIELIVVNDGSTDKSDNIIRKLKEEKDFIYISHSSNKGLSAARNSALDVFTGKYVYFLDSDDWITCGYLDELYKTIKSTNSNIVFNSNIRAIHSKDNFEYAHIKIENERFINPKKERFFIPFGICYMLFESSVITENNIRFIENYNNEDISFQTIISPFVDKVYLFNGLEKYFVNRREGSITYDYNNMYPKDILNQVDEVYKFFKERNINYPIPYYHIFVFLYNQFDKDEIVLKTIDMMYRHGFDIGRLELPEDLSNKYKFIIDNYIL